MDVLDADDTPLRSSQGVTQKRDIVQFVPFNKFVNSYIGALAKETESFYYIYQFNFAIIKEKFLVSSFCYFRRNS